jgi:ATP-dependent Clp protease ATP-binding subunit ClpC
MSNLNPNIPSPELAGLMTTAVSQMKTYQLKLLTPQLLLRHFLDEPESVAYKILQQLQKQKGFAWDDLVQRVEMMAHHTKGRSAKFNFTDDFGKNQPLAEEMLVVLDEGRTLAQSREELKVSSGHTLAAMAQPNVTTYGVLQRVGVTSEAVAELLNTFTKEGEAILHDFVAEAQEGQLTTLYQREGLLRDLTGLLALSQNRHVLLVGPEGAGKRSLVYSLAQLIAEGKGPEKLRSVVEINETAMLEDPLGAIRAGMRRASGGILLVPNIEQFFADRLRAKYPEHVSRELHKALLGNDQVVIGTTIPAEVDRLQDNRLIRENSNRLDVPPASVTETVAMLMFHKPALELDYEIQIEREAFETATTIAGQYIKTIALPAAAVQLVNRACALVRMVTQSKVENMPEVTADGRLHPEDVMVAASQMTKIPLQKLGEDEQDKYANMMDHLHQRIIGQAEAVEAVSRAVKTARVGLRDKKRPIGSFLFLGPSGVGKTELAKALAEFMFGTEKAMLVLDMSEYQGEASVNRLIGSPPGYIGHEAGGQLTNFVRERPYTVVLFDEVEKAHQRVFDVLLQVMEEGRLTDSKGQLATFSETVIIMTSNLGSSHMLVPHIDDAIRDDVMADMRTFFRPEFLNRMDDVIMFHQLTGPQLAKILDLLLNKEVKLAAEQKIDLAITHEAKQWLLAKNDQPEYGARPLRRIIARYLREPLANFLLSQKRRDGKTIVIVDDFENTPELDFQIGDQ